MKERKRPEKAKRVLKKKHKAAKLIAQQKLTEIPKNHIASRKLLCPACGSDNITLWTGGVSGIYQCCKCGYIGPIIIEED
jgi:Zn ribbon nucleic-acid-binding protein